MAMDLIPTGPQLIKATVTVIIGMMVVNTIQKRFPNPLTQAVKEGL